MLPTEKVGIDGSGGDGDGGGNSGFVAVSSIDDDHYKYAADEPGDHVSDCGESYSASNGLKGDHPQESGPSDKAKSSGVNYAGLSPCFI